MKPTHTHHDLVPELCDEFFDAAIKNVPNDFVSRQLAQGMVGTCHWLAPHLGRFLTTGKLSLSA